MNNQPKHSFPILYSNTTLPEALTLFSNHIPSSLHDFLLEHYNQLSNQIHELEDELESLEQELTEVKDDLAEADVTIAALEQENEKLRNDIAKSSKQND